MVYDIISKPYQSDNTVIPKYNRMAEMSTYIAHWQDASFFMYSIILQDKSKLNAH